MDVSANDDLHISVHIRGIPCLDLNRTYPAIYIVGFQAVVRACRKGAVRIRCIGSAHSWAPYLAEEDSLLMYMKDLRREHGEQIILLEVNFSDESHLCNSYQVCMCDCKIKTS